MASHIQALENIKVPITGSKMVFARITNGKQLGVTNITLVLMAGLCKVRSGSMVSDITLELMGHFIYETMTSQDILTYQVLVGVG